MGLLFAVLLFSITGAAFFNSGDEEAQHIRALVECLGVEDQMLREACKDELTSIGQPAVEPLLEALKDEDPLVRRNAIYILRNIASEEGFISEDSVDLLIKALEDEDPEVRRYVTFTLGYTGGPAAVDALLNTLDDEDPWVVQGAVSALGNIGDPSTVDPLLGLLDHENEEVRRNVLFIFAYDFFDPRTFVPLSEHFLETGEGSHAVLANAVAYGKEKEAAAVFKEVLNSKNPGIRADAVRALGDLDDPDTVEILIGMLVDRDPDVRLAVVDTLGRIGPEAKKAVEPLINSLDAPGRKLSADQKSTAIRRATIRALGKIGDERAVPALTGLLEDKDQRARSLVLSALESIAGPASVEPVRESLEDEHWTVRAQAIEVLGRLEGRAAIEYIFPLLRDEDWHVRVKAAETLAGLGDPAAVEPLIQALDFEREERVRVALIAALGDLGDSAAVEPLTRIMQDKNEFRRVRARAAAALGLIGDPAAVDALLEVLNNNNEYWTVRGDAAVSIGLIDNYESEPKISLKLLAANSSENPKLRKDAEGALWLLSRKEGRY